MILGKLKSLRLRDAVLVAAVGLLGFASSAAAVIYIYTNGFNSREAYTEIDQKSGSKDCDKDYLEDSKSMRVEVIGRDFCEYTPPVAGDENQPNHEILADGRLLTDTPKDFRKQAYLAVRVRVGQGAYYELRINPKEDKYKISREPNSNDPALPLKGTSNQINKLGEDNLLRLRVTGNKLSAFVNGTKLEDYVDADAGEVDGRKVSFGVGSTKKSQDEGPIGVFKSIRVGIPSP